MNAAGKLTGAIDPHFPVVAVGTVVENAVVVVKFGWFEPKGDRVAFVIDEIDRDRIVIRLAVGSGQLPPFNQNMTIIDYNDWPFTGDKLLPSGAQ